MPGSANLEAGDRPLLAELAPVLQRAVALDPAGLVRLRFGGGRATALVRLPFSVLVSRTVEGSRDGPLDVTVAVRDALAWLDGDAPEPAARDHEWRTGLPPGTGWRRIETVPDSVIRPLVRQGALTLRDAANREGVPGAQPRSEVADALLDSVVLTVAEGNTDDTAAEITLRVLSALTRMGFLRKDGHAHVDLAGRWIRVVGEFGSVYLERQGLGLTVT